MLYPQGELAENRYSSYLKLQKELAFLDQKNGPRCSSRENETNGKKSRKVCEIIRRRKVNNKRKEWRITI